MGLSILAVAVDDTLFDDPSAACMAQPYLMALGYCFAFSALYSKTRLVNKVFHKPAFALSVIKKADVISPMALLVGSKFIARCSRTGSNLTLVLISERCRSRYSDGYDTFALGAHGCGVR